MSALPSLVPAHLPSLGPSLRAHPTGRALLDIFRASSSLLVLTGAGISTASGVPDYRSPGRAAYRPIQHREFIDSETTRRRYWARSAVGWTRMQLASPNAAHFALAQLEAAGGPRILPLITQNVDRLHQRAGHANVLELHGSIHEVECLSCKHTMGRASVQALVVAQNGAFLERYGLLLHQQREQRRQAAAAAAEEEVETAGQNRARAPQLLVRPDGDVDLPSEAYADFVVPTCERCGATLLKPSVVFHGGSVPVPVAEAAADLSRRCDAVLVVGSTVTTFSAFRLVRDAHKRGAKVGVVNFGATRVDELGGVVKVEADVAGVLEGLVREGWVV
jgi:NAD-dependent deacetylase sirtuin 4